MKITPGITAQIASTYLRTIFLWSGPVQARAAHDVVPGDRVLVLAVLTTAHLSTNTFVAAGSKTGWISMSFLQPI